MLLSLCDNVVMKNFDLLFEKLEEEHPNAKCELLYSSPFELLVAVILSAQCTDKRVNETTRKLFQEMNTPNQFAEIEQSQLEKKIYSCGFYRNKAKNLIGCSKSIVENFDGNVPNNVDELMTLDGVGKKTANVVFSEAFGGDAIAVDTHVSRVANRLGLAKSKNPLEIEEELKKLFPKEKWSRLHHLMIFHGRYTCHSQKPDCKNCSLFDFCTYDKKKNK